MDLKIDFAFKQLFGIEKNKDITIVLLNAILQRTGRAQIKNIWFSNTEAGGEHKDDNQSRLDILAVTDAGESINVEIQFSNKYDMVKRSIYYWVGVYRTPIKKSMSYKELNPVIAINILNFDLLDQTDCFHTTYHLYEDREKFKLTDVMEIHFIEMTKLIRDWQADKLDPQNDVLARWLLMLGMVDRRNGKVYEDIYKELEVIAMKDETLHEAFENWEALSGTAEQMIAYEGRMKRIFDEEATVREAQLRIEEAEEAEEAAKVAFKVANAAAKVANAAAKEAAKEAKDAAKEAKKAITAAKAASKIAIEEAVKETKQSEKTKIARHLLSVGMDIESVILATELTEEQVLAINKQI